MPQDFKAVSFSTPEYEIPGEMIGSTRQLCEECRALAELLDVPKDLIRRLTRCGKPRTHQLTVGRSGETTVGIDYPILQAPMGGESTTRMVTAVCNAGGLGGLGCSYMSGEEIRHSVDEIRSATNGTFNLNFFAHSEPSEDSNINEQTQTWLAPFYEELGMENMPSRVDAPCNTFDESKLALLMEIRPKVVSFHFGLPPQNKFATQL